MKNTILIAALIILPFLSSSQSKFRVGVRAGANYVNQVFKTNADIELPEPNDYRLSFHAGVISEYRLNDKFSISPELMLSSKGYQYVLDENFENAGEKVKIQLNYVSMPILVKYQFLDKFCLGFGSEIGYMIDASRKEEDGIYELLDFWKEYDDFNRLDFSLVGAFSFSPLDRFDIGFRYIHGFSSMWKNMILTDVNGYIVDGKAKIQNRTFQLSVAYMIDWPFSVKEK
jgi:hypothetical protein